MRLLSSLFILIGLNLLLLVPLIAHADDASRDKEISHRFAKCDTNHDGKLTKEEANGCMPRIYSHFSYIDSANKGYVTVAESQALANR